VNAEMTRRVGTAKKECTEFYIDLRRRQPRG
jgi:hypothetical protein